MMNGGIDDQIQQRIMASGGNPQKLMQAYNQKKELLDLLALQKLKSDKEAAMRNMQMQMQQNPQTVKQQRENEVMQLTKQELAADVGKTLAQQQARSQNNLQRVANQGIATAPARNMTRMANGGIVGFAGPQGSQVQGAQGRFTPMLRRPAPSTNIYASAIDRLTPEASEDTEEERNRIRTIDEIIAEDFGGSRARAKQRFLELENKGRGSVRNLTPTEAKEFESLRGEFEVSPIRSGITSLIQGAQNIRKQLTTPTTQLEEMGTDDEDPYATQPQVQQPQRPPVPTEDETDYVEGGSRAATGQTEGEQRLEERVGTEAPAPNAFAGLQTRDVTVPESKVPSLDASKYQVQYDNTGLESLQKQFEGMAGIDKDKAREAGYTSAMGRIDYTPEERAGLQSLIDERKALEAGRMDPKKLARERLQARLLGAQGSTLGSTFRTSGLAGERARGRQEEAEYKLLEDRQAKIKDLIEKSQGIRKEAYEYGTKDREEAGRDIRAGLEGQLGISREQADRAESNANRLLETDTAILESGDRQRQMELRTALQMADQAFTRDIKIIEGSLEQQKIDAQKAYNEAMVNSNDKRYAENALVNVNKTIGDITSAYDEMYNERISNVQSGLVQGFKEQADIDAEVARLQAQRDDVLNLALKDLREQQARLDGILTGGGTGGFTVKKKSP